MSSGPLFDAAAAYRAAIQTCNDGFWLSNAEGRIFEVNDAYVKRSGYSREELLSMRIPDLEAKESPEETAAHIAKIIRNGRDTFETLHRTKTGEVWHVEVNVAYWDFGGGLFFNFLCDISGRKQAEEALRTSEERYRRLIEYSPISVGVVGPDGAIEYINRKAYETFGYANEEIPHMNDWWVLAYPDPAYRAEVIESWMGQVMKAFEDNTEIRPNEYRVTCKDGSVKTMLISGVPIGSKLLVLFNDISDRKTAELELEKHRSNLEELVAERTRELSQLNDMLRESQKLEAIGLLAGGIAHDFNNILATIKGAVYILNKSIDRGSPQARYADQILTSIKRGADLAQSLLAFSRKQSITLRALDLNDLLGSGLPLLERLVGEMIEISLELQPGLPCIMGDRNQVQQILINLVSNSVYAMPDGGKIRIRTTVAGTENLARLHEGMGLAEEYVVLEVADSGIGISDEIREKIFEPFFTTKEIGQGTGLGLSVTYGLVKQHNGFVSFDSSPGCGTVFRVYLPCCEHRLRSESATHVPLSAGDASAPRKSGTILFAEDDEPARKITAEILNLEGYEVLEARDGAEALEIFLVEMEHIDLVLLDVRMPRRNGKEVHDEIKKVKPDATVLFVSGYTEDIIDNEGILREGLNFLPKSASPEVLLETIRMLLERT